MSTKEGYCKFCKEKTVLENKKCNHILNLLLSLITGGCWIIIWIFCADSAQKKWHCTKCHSENVAYPIKMDYCKECDEITLFFSEGRYKCSKCGSKKWF